MQEKGECASSCATGGGAEKAGECERKGKRERRVGEERSKHEYSTAEFIRHFMHSRRALLCIHFYGLESDFLFLNVRGAREGGRDAEARESWDEKMVKDGLTRLWSFVSCSFLRFYHSLIE